MNTSEPTAASPAPGSFLDVRWLTPADTHIFEGTFSLLHCTVKGVGLFRGVFAVMLFPISYPNRFISLCYHDAEDKIQEIGIIATLEDFPEEAQKLIRESLAKQYYEEIITRVYDIKYEYRLLFFDVETLNGRKTFMLPWRYDRAEDYSDSGKLLLDSYDNRYIIPDVSQLPPADRRRFTNYIYW
jgi:hypothetical protein